MLMLDSGVCDGSDFIDNCAGAELTGFANSGLTGVSTGAGLTGICAGAGLNVL